MIRKLRKKFILTNMLLVTLVLLAVFAALLGSTAQQRRVESLGAMRMALEWGGKEPPRFEIGAAPPGPAADGDRTHGRENRQFAMTPVFCVTLDGDGAVEQMWSGGSVSVSDEVLSAAVEEALASGKAEGTLGGLGLRYLIDRQEDGAVRLAFADLSWERDSLKSLVPPSLLVGAGALAVFFLISLFLSSLALRPAEKAWQQQRQFVADASHELKTPLTVILANTGIVLSHRSELGGQAKWVEYIQEEAGRMKGLVYDLLFLARSDDGTHPPRRDPVGLSELCMGCLLPFESVAFENGVALESEITPGLSVVGDEAQLRRLVMILLDNAVKYAGEGGRAGLSLSRQQEKLRLEVRNTGAPIPPEHLEHLFERFYRVDSARGRGEGGYGLGLAIAQRIAEAHHAKISVHSGEEQGTVFSVVFPRK